MKVMAVMQGADVLPDAIYPMIETVGTRSFGQNMVQSLERICGAAFVAVYTFRAANRRTSLVMGGSAGGGDIVARNGQRYAARYVEADPACRAFLRMPSRRAPLATHVLRDELTDPQHRGMLEDEGVPDRIALFFPLGRDWASLHIMRRRTRDSFTDAELDRITALAPVYGALIGRHLHKEDVDREEAKRELEDRLLRTGAELSRREVEICIGLVIGEPMREVAAGLGISVFSAQTYRERAYCKLGVSTQQQLSLMLMGCGSGPSPVRH